MKIAFWNVNLGDSSFPFKKRTFQTWCKETSPDLLILEEVSAKIMKGQGQGEGKFGEPLESLTGMRLLNTVYTQTSALLDSTKCLCALERKYKDNVSPRWSAKVLRFPGLISRRAAIKAVKLSATSISSEKTNVGGDKSGGGTGSSGSGSECKDVPEDEANKREDEEYDGPLDTDEGNDTNRLVVWGIHANASTRGGVAAANAVRDYLSSCRNAVVGGDFNHPLSNFKEGCTRKSGVNACCPQNHLGNEMNFTQWNSGYGTAVSSDERRAAFYIQSATTNHIYKNLKRNAVIDYVAYGSKRTVQAERNCTKETTWRDILSQFDHCPVIYEIE
jgi:hypothetical protein